MFSVEQKREIAGYVGQILAETNHDDLPTSGNTQFYLHVYGKHHGSFSIIQNNKAVPDPDINPYNEIQDKESLVKQAKILDKLQKALEELMCYFSCTTLR